MNVVILNEGIEEKRKDAIKVVGKPGKLLTDFFRKEAPGERCLRTPAPRLPSEKAEDLTDSVKLITLNAKLAN